MTHREWQQHYESYMAFFNAIPLEHRAEAEALYQAFKSRIICELNLPWEVRYGTRERLGYQSDGEGAAL